jgi:hypothetical protein
VSSDREAWRLAERLGARLVLVDPDRTGVPISGTDIRRDPLAAWRYLPPPVHAHYARCVVLLGPESTFARALATALDPVYVPEQACLFAERRAASPRRARRKRGSSSCRPIPRRAWRWRSRR